MAWSGIVGDRLIAAVELRDPKLHIARHLGPGLRFGLGPGAGDLRPRAHFVWCNSERLWKTTSGVRNSLETGEKAQTG
jgi:hypothetical protein